MFCFAKTYRPGYIITHFVYQCYATDTLWNEKLRNWDLIPLDSHEQSCTYAQDDVNDH